MNLEEIMRDYAPFTQRILKLIKSISVPKEIGDKEVFVHYYGTEYGWIYGDIFQKRFKIDGRRFCQIGYKIITKNKIFGFESRHVDMFYINFCLLQDGYVFIMKTYVPGELRRTCIGPSEPIISNKFTNGDLLTDELNNEIKSLKIMRCKKMDISEFFAFLKNPLR